MTSQTKDSVLTSFAARYGVRILAMSVSSGSISIASLVDKNLKIRPELDDIER